MKGLALLAAVALACAGCGPCGPFVSKAKTKTSNATLVAGAPPTRYDVTAVAGAQDCGSGCNACGEPRIAIAVSGRQASGASSPVGLVIVRATLKARAPDGVDGFVPPDPVDWVLDPSASTPVAFTIDVTRSCQSTHGCEAAYVLTLERIEPAPQGDVAVELAVDASYDSSVMGAVSVTLSPSGPST